MDRSTLGERASHGQIYLRESHGEIYSHGQIYLRRESQPWTDLPDERARNGQIYLMRQHAMGRST